MTQIPIEIPWMISPSEDVVSYAGEPGLVRVTVCCQISRRAHRAWIARWEASHQTPIPDALYNESAGFLLDLRFDCAAFFCRNALQYRWPPDPPAYLDPEAFNRLWDETGVCPDPGFYRVPDSPLAALLQADRRFTHWRLCAQGEELHVLARSWEAARQSDPGDFLAEAPEKGPWRG